MMQAALKNMPRRASRGVDCALPHLRGEGTCDRATDRDDRPLSLSTRPVTQEAPIRLGDRKSA